MESYTLNTMELFKDQSAFNHTIVWPDINMQYLKFESFPWGFAKSSVRGKLIQTDDVDTGIS